MFCAAEVLMYILLLLPVVPRKTAGCGASWFRDPLVARTRNTIHVWPAFRIGCEADITSYICLIFDLCVPTKPFFRGQSKRTRFCPVFHSGLSWRSGALSTSCTSAGLSQAVAPLATPSEMRITSKFCLDALWDCFLTTLSPPNAFIGFSITKSSRT